MSSLKTDTVIARSLEESCGIPDIFFVILDILGTHAALVDLRTWQVIHIRHLANLGNRLCTDELLPLTTAHSLVILLVLGVLVLALSLLFTIKNGKLLLEGVVLHAKLTLDRDEATETVNVVLILFVDLFVHLQGFVEEVHSSVATCDHELPFHFLGLNLTGTFEVLDGLFKHVLFGVVHSKA